MSKEKNDSIFIKEDKVYKTTVDKLTLGFIADVLYIKGIICYEEFEDIMNVTCAEDLGVITEKLLRSDYNVFKRGEGYITN